MTWACHSASFTDTGLTQTPHRSAGGNQRKIDNLQIIHYNLTLIYLTFSLLL